MNTQYRMDKTPVATKNRASLDTSIDIPDTFEGSPTVVLLQINSPTKKMAVFEHVHFLVNVFKSVYIYQSGMDTRFCMVEEHQ